MDNWTEATTFAGLLKECRFADGLTQAELARRSGLSVRGIQHLESGETRPYRHTREQLAAALRLSGEERARFEDLSLPVPRRRPPARPAPSQPPPEPPQSYETAEHTARLLALAQWGLSLLAEISTHLEQHGLCVPQPGHLGDVGRSAVG